MFSTSEISSTVTSLLASPATQGTGAVLGRRCAAQRFQRAMAPAAGGHLRYADLRTIGINDRTNMQGLDEPAPSDGFRHLLDRCLGRYSGWIVQHQLVEGMSRDDDRVIL